MRWDCARHGSVAEVEIWTLDKIIKLLSAAQKPFAFTSTARAAAAAVCVTSCTSNLLPHEYLGTLFIFTYAFAAYLRWTQVKVSQQFTHARAHTPQPPGTARESFILLPAPNACASRSAHMSHGRNRLHESRSTHTCSRSWYQND